MSLSIYDFTPTQLVDTSLKEKYFAEDSSQLQLEMIDSTFSTQQQSLEVPNTSKGLGLCNIDESVDLSYDVESTYGDKGSGFDYLNDNVSYNYNNFTNYNPYEIQLQQQLLQPKKLQFPISSNFNLFPTPNSFTSTSNLQINSPLFDDPPSELPELDFSSSTRRDYNVSTPTLNDFNQEFTSLFPELKNTSVMSSQTRFETLTPLNNDFNKLFNDETINPFYSESSFQTEYSTPASYTASLHVDCQEPLQSVETLQASNSSKSVKTLIPIDAPIQPRNSSRKRKAKSTLIKKKDESDFEDDEEERVNPLNLKGLKATDRKRILNTVSARKSRAKKQEKFAEMEKLNQELRNENERLKLSLVVLKERSRIWGGI